MLYPVLTSSRLLSDLSGVWDFKLDYGKGFEEEWFQKPLENPMTMPVPAAYNDLKEGIDFPLRFHILTAHSPGPQTQTVSSSPSQTVSQPLSLAG